MPETSTTHAQRAAVLSRHRGTLTVALPVVIALGIASRAFPFLFPVALGKYPGDTLWALMVFVGAALVRPTLRPGRLALLALMICWLVEFSQLYQAPWLNTIRATRLGHAVLGSGFHALDLAAYGIGVGLGMLLDRALFWRTTTRVRSS